MQWVIAALYVLSLMFAVAAAVLAFRDAREAREQFDANESAHSGGLHRVHRELDQVAARIRVARRDVALLASAAGTNAIASILAVFLL